MAFGLFKKKENTPAASNKTESRGPHYYDLAVKNIINETKDAITIVFEHPAEKVNYKSGQFLTLIIPIQGKEVRRA